MNAPRTYRKKAATVEAIQWLGPQGGAIDALVDWGANVQPGEHWDGPEWPLQLRALTGPASLMVGDWIIKGREPGDFYPCGREVFPTLFDLEEP